MGSRTVPLLRCGSSTQAPPGRGLATENCRWSAFPDYPAATAQVCGLSGFSLVDPAGNWIRVMRDSASGLGAETTAEPAAGKLAAAVANAVVLADCQGDTAQAVKILAGAVTRNLLQAAVPVQVEALAYLAELHVRLGDPDSARRPWKSWSCWISPRKIVWHAGQSCGKPGNCCRLRRPHYSP